MASKIYADAASALDGLLFDGMTIAQRRIRPVRHPRAADRRDPGRGHQGSHLRVEQCRHRRAGPRQAAAHAPGQEDDLVLCRREQGVRAAVSLRRAGGGVLPAGHARRAAARGRRGHSRLLHQDRRRHAGGRGQGSEAVRRRGLYPRARHPRRSRHHQGLEGGRGRQPDLPQDRAQLQRARCRPPARSASPRWRRSCRSAASIPMRSICPASM